MGIKRPKHGEFRTIVRSRNPGARVRRVGEGDCGGHRVSGWRLLREGPPVDTDGCLSQSTHSQRLALVCVDVCMCCFIFISRAGVRNTKETMMGLNSLLIGAEIEFFV